MPFLCYVLRVHDCVISIMGESDLSRNRVKSTINFKSGSLSGIEEYLVWAFATKGWHMYFGSLLSALRFVCSFVSCPNLIVCSGSRGTPAMSILSKCVPSSQLGKIFSLFGAFQTLLGMIMSYLNTMVH